MHLLNPNNMEDHENDRMTLIPGLAHLTRMQDALTEKAGGPLSPALELSSELPQQRWPLHDHSEGTKLRVWGVSGSTLHH